MTKFRVHVQGIQQGHPQELGFITVDDPDFTKTINDKLNHMNGMLVLRDSMTLMTVNMAHYDSIQIYMKPVEDEK